jgi:hypothetical protein
MTFALFVLYLVLAYIQPGEMIPALAPYRLAYWAGLAGLAVGVLSIAGKPGKASGHLQLWTLIAFTTVMCVSLVIAERWPGAPALILQRFGPSLTMFVLAMSGVTSLGRLRVAAGCVILVTTALALQGAAAYHVGFDTRLLLQDGAATDEDTDADTDEEQAETDPHPDDDTVQDELRQPPRIRAFGFMNDPNDLALGMVVALGLVCGAWQTRLQFRNLLLALTAGALVYGIYLTRSRGGAIALAIVLWRFAANRVGRLPALVLLVVLSAALMALDFGGRSLEADESASGRVEAWTEGFEMLKMHPLLGVGYGQFIDHHTLTAHNSLVLCFAETGLLGSFLWVGLFVVTLLELRGVRHLAGTEPFDRSARRWAEGLQLSVFGFMAAAFFLSRTFAPTLYLVLGLSVALVTAVRNAGRPIPLPPPAALWTLVLACALGSIAVVYVLQKLHLA